MANQWSNPQYQRNRIPSTSEDPTPADQWQIATQPDTSATIPHCSRASCSATRHNGQSARHTVQHQDPWFPVDPSAPIGSQSIGIANPASVATIMNGQVQTQFRTPQAPWTRNEDGYVPLQDAARPIQAQTGVGIEQAQVPDIMLVTESLRRLAGGYFNNPEALVNAIRLEPGSPGRLRVVITLEVADIL